MKLPTTPGTWRARPGLDPWRWVIVAIVANREGNGGGAILETDHPAAHTPEVEEERRVAAIQTRGDLASVQECAANARVFAASKDLLAACEELIYGDDLQVAIDRARAALARVEGRKP